MSAAFDTTALETERDGLQSEILVVSELMEKCIYENAHVALDQIEYQKRYEELTQRFETLKSMLDSVTETISDKKSRKASIEVFLKNLEGQMSLIEKFDTALWCELLDFVAVHAKGSVRFTFKNGIKSLRQKLNLLTDMTAVRRFFAVSQFSEPQTSARQHVLVCNLLR